MKRWFQRIVLSVLFGVSLGTAGAILVTEARAGTSGVCPKCATLTMQCPGSTCECQWNDLTQSYLCLVLLQNF